MMKMRLVFAALSFALSTAAIADMTPESIRAIREYVEHERQTEDLKNLSPDEKASRQASIDAEVTYHFKKRVQMRPSEVKKIDPACDEWLKLYKETGWAKAQQGIRSTCP